MICAFNLSALGESLPHHSHDCLKMTNILLSLVSVCTAGHSGTARAGNQRGFGEVRSGNLYKSLLFRNLVVRNMFRAPRDDSAVFQKIQGRFLEPSKSSQPSVTPATGDLTPSSGF